MAEYSLDQLKELLEQVRIDKAAFMRARGVLSNRLSDVKARDVAGELTSDVRHFSGTQAAMGAIGLSIVQFDYMIQALECQIEDMEGRRDNVYALPERKEPDDDEC